MRPKILVTAAAIVAKAIKPLLLRRKIILPGTMRAYLEPTGWAGERAPCPFDFYF